MTRLKFILLFTLSLLISWTVQSQEAKKDSANSFNSFQLFQLKNQWLNSGNTAGMVFNPDKRIGIVDGGYQLTDGDYHRIREANHKDDYYLSSESYQRIKNIYFYGKFAYHYSDEKGSLWNGVFEPYRGTPYIIGDSIPGTTYHKENFLLSGGAATKLSGKISVGILAKYFVATGAKQKDPRPKNTVTDFSINPSVVVQFSKSKIGLNIGYRNRQEEISYEKTVTDNANPTFFMFKGMGFFNAETALSKFRIQTENKYFGGLQYETSLFNFGSLTEIKGAYSSEETKDGSSTIIKKNAGDWNTYKIELKEQLIRINCSFIQKITFNGSYFKGEGIGYNQKQVPNDDDITKYVTISKYLFFKRKTFDAKLEYNYLKLRDNNTISWEASLFARVKNNKETYYYVPETFTADYTNIEPGIKLSRNFYANKLHIAPILKISYLFNCSKNLDLSDDEEITQKQNTDLYQHDFDYYTTNRLNASLLVNCGYKMPTSKSIDELTVKVGYQHQQVFDPGKHLGILTAKVGFIF